MAGTDKDKLNLAEVSAIGGGMTGDGIVAVLGLAIATAGHAVPLTLAGCGIIAVLTGLPYAHLGLHLARQIGLAPLVPLAGGVLASASLYLLLAVYGMVVAGEAVLIARRGRRSIDLVPAVARSR